MSTTTSQAGGRSLGTPQPSQTARPPAVAQVLADLDERSRSVYEAVRDTVESRGYPPSLREIGTTVGLTSPSSVKHQLDKLQRLGLVHRDPRRPRAMEVVLPDGGRRAGDTTGRADSRPAASTGPGTDPPAPPPSPRPAPSAEQAAAAHQQAGRDAALPQAPPGEGETVAVPLVGRIAAGTPILAEQQLEEVVWLPRRLTGSGELFMLQVHGDSMMEAAICDGDWVVVRAQPDAEAGEVVAAMVDDVDGASATVKVLSRRGGHQWLLPRNPGYAPIDGDRATIMGKVVTVLRSL